MTNTLIFFGINWNIISNKFIKLGFPKYFFCPNQPLLAHDYNKFAYHLTTRGYYLNFYNSSYDKIFPKILYGITKYRLYYNYPYNSY